MNKKGWNVCAENFKENQYTDGQETKGRDGEAVRDDDPVGGA